MDSIVINGIEYRRYNSAYGVSINGQAIRLRDLQTAKAHRRSDGYFAIRNMLLHRMIAICWLEKPPNANHVHHIDGNKANNRADNLEWVTPKQHLAVRHKGTIGRHQMSDSTKQKLREYRKTFKHTEVTKQKIRKTVLQSGIKPPSWAGKQHKVSTRLKMSLNHAKATPCEVRGIQYASYAEAGRALGERPLGVRWRCLSGKFPDYKRLL